MGSRIRVLDDALVDQIAAGEVVERPASVIKELVENALDAGARNITVTLSAGGVDRISVTDDGTGMSAEDAVLSVRRHATSKIASVADLVRVRTLGFRGEALPSIASVSRFTLTTRREGDVAATVVHIDSGGPPQVGEAGAPAGTTVEVRDLFYNVPARRKFLRSTAAESARATDVCMRSALLDPALRLTLQRQGGRTRQLLPVATEAERAQQVFHDIPLRQIETDKDGVRIRAHVGPPERARSNAAGLYVFVNGRPVRDRALTRSIAFAYGSVLPPGRYPCGVVFVDVETGDVDVNVHPQKAEVRFADGRRTLDAITRGLATKLGTSPWSGPAGRSGNYWHQRLEPHAEPPRGVPAGVQDGQVAYSVSSTPTPAPTTPPLGEPGGLLSSLKVLGQARRMLIICEGPDGLHILDQHAADERIRYHQLRTGFASGDVSVQRLLFPERVSVAEADVALLEQNREGLLKAGLETDTLGPTTIAVRSVPTVLGRAAPAQLLRDVLAEMSYEGDRAFGDAMDTAFATMACHAALRAGDALSHEECVALVRTLDSVPDFAGHCPHGRPVVSVVPFEDIERRLGR